jgi:hypothetical protein
MTTTTISAVASERSRQEQHQEGANKSSIRKEPTRTAAERSRQAAMNKIKEQVKGTDKYKEKQQEQEQEAATRNRSKMQ